VLETPSIRRLQLPGRGQRRFEVRVVGDILWWILLVYLWIIIARLIIGWLPFKWPRPLRPLVVLIYDITEPVLSPLRRWIPVVPLSEGVGLDLSPMVVIVIIIFMQWLVNRIFS
jgi:YggT family protein